ncbi:MAG: YdcF family protein, partial [Alphaproteobacteria bacterium]|nr:YdcF family protein [Alphaproteobacteria bacterium]
KTFWIIAAPANLALIAGVLGVLFLWTRWRAFGRYLATFGIAVLVVLAVLPIGSWLALPLENRFGTPNPMPARVTGIIVLGGSENVSQTRLRGIVAVNGSADRLIAFADLARRYPEARLVYTGGSGSLRPGALREADVARQALQIMGVDTDRVIFERESRNTFENARNLKPMVAPADGDTWLLVTSALYMPRAAGVFRKADWPVLPYPVDHSQGFGPPRLSLDWDLAGRASSAQQAMREWIGLVVYRVLGRTSAVLPSMASNQ